MYGFRMICMVSLPLSTAFPCCAYEKRIREKGLGPFILCWLNSMHEALKNFLNWICELRIVEWRSITFCRTFGVLLAASEFLCTENEKICQKLMPLKMSLEINMVELVAERITNQLIWIKSNGLIVFYCKKCWSFKIFTARESTFSILVLNLFGKINFNSTKLASVFWKYSLQTYKMKICCINVLQSHSPKTDKKPHVQIYIS